MLKDKITSEMRNKFKYAIKLTFDTGKEQAFFICKDEKGNLSSTPISSGTSHHTAMGPPIKCPFKTQGNFHTHPDISNIKKALSPREISDETAKYAAIALAKKQGLPIITPSHPDLMIAL